MEREGKKRKGSKVKLSKRKENCVAAFVEQTVVS